MEDTRSLSQVIVFTVIDAITTVLSLKGNSLVCFAFCRNRRLRRTITNFYVLSLAIADMTAAMFAFPFFTVASGLRRWPFNDIFCQFTGFLVYYWAQVSLGILALTATNRYFCVVKPHLYSTYFSKKKTAVSILAVWIILFIFYLTFTMTLPVASQWDPNSFHCRAMSLDKRTDKIIYVFYGCFFIISMLLVMFGYGSVYRVVRQHNNTVAPSLRDPNIPATTHLQDIKACRLLFAAVLGFFACWTPLSVSFILGYGCDVSIPSVAQSIFTMFSTFSTWINPIIYGVLNRAMRKEFRNILLCRQRE